VFIEEPRLARADVHGLEATVPAQSSKIIGTQNGAFGRHDSDAEESYHTIIGHRGSLARGAQ
jgi:hypothetical protein